jgi:hypothetical protein
MGSSDLSRRQFAALTAATAATWRSAAEAEPATPVLYPGEELTEASGYPALVCVMDTIAMILVTIPVFLPVILKLHFGLSPDATVIWFGIIGTASGG